MNEKHLREVVDTVIRHHLSRRAQSTAVKISKGGSGGSTLDHPSHRKFPLKNGAGANGPCLIEPAVACVHCGYCQSHGY